MWQSLLQNRRGRGFATFNAPISYNTNALKCPYKMKDMKNTLLLTSLLLKCETWMATPTTKSLQDPPIRSGLSIFTLQFGHLQWHILDSATSLGHTQCTVWSVDRKAQFKRTPSIGWLRFSRDFTGAEMDWCSLEYFSYFCRFWQNDSRWVGHRYCYPGPEL